MRCVRVWFLVNLLIIFGLMGCSQTPASSVTEAVSDSASNSGPSAATPLPQSPQSVAPTATASSKNLAASSHETASPTLVTTVPSVAVEINQEEKMAVGTSIPASSDQTVLHQIEQAKNDLTQRLGVDASQIAVLEAREVTWPDTSLGCPEEGVVYEPSAQVGLLIRLGVNRQMYFYHSDKTSPPFLCEQTLPLFKGTPKVDEMVPPPDSEID